MKICTVLFDLDGTLLDTAPDIAYALNQVRRHHNLPELPIANVRASVSHGMRALIKLGFNIEEDHESYAILLEECLSLYEKHSTDMTCLFPEMELVLKYLNQQGIPWGIVTNKPSRFTFTILKNIKLEFDPACVVCGDTLVKRKPDPATILHACHLLQQPTSGTVYIGDSNSDVMASKAAGTTSLVALYGYIGENEDPFAWQADGYIRKPSEVIEWLKKYASRK